MNRLDPSGRLFSMIIQMHAAVQLAEAGGADLLVVQEEFDEQILVRPVQSGSDLFDAEICGQQQILRKMQPLLDDMLLEPHVKAFVKQLADVIGVIAEGVGDVPYRQITVSVDAHVFGNTVGERTAAC